MLLLLLRSAAGGSDVTVTPGAGSLTLTGYAPTVTATSNATASPGTGALVITGYAPTVTVPTSVTVTPGVGSLTITGYQPTISTADPLEGPQFDYHDGSPRKDTWSQGQRDKEKRNKIALRQAIEQAITQTLGNPKPDLPPQEAAPVSTKSIKREHRQAIAELLLRSGIDLPQNYPLKKIESEIKSVERKLRTEQARITKNIEDEDEDDLIFLLLS